MDTLSMNDLLPLLDGMTDSEVGEFVDSLPVQAREALLDALGGVTQAEVPSSPLELAKAIDEAYRERPHLVYLSERIEKAVSDVEQGRNRFLSISMPPRMGKTEMASIKTPLSILGRHPDWKIGLLSYSPALSASWGREIRRAVVEHHDLLGVEVAKDAGAVTDWQTTKRGRITSRSVQQGIAGLGFKVLVMDDLVKDSTAAHSEPQRDSLWRWLVTDALSRLEPPYLVVLIGCLTGDTPVLMADGSERPIREIKTGDSVATYEGGRLVASTVTNWANQGPDHLYSVRMASGRVVRANARHPFLTVDENGVETWQRTDSLKAGQSILTVTGVNGEGSPVPRMGATGRSAVRGYVPRTTTSEGGQKATGEEARSNSADLISGTGTGLTLRTLTGCSRHKEEFVRSASGLLIPKTLGVGECCSSITATIQKPSEDSSATIATSSSVMVQPSNVSWPLSNTYELTLDRIESITPEGYEDVYDIEVDRTHNFVANGLVTHNTRWHEDDVIGRALSKTHYEWEVIKFPALAEGDDVLGRAEGEPLLSPLIEETQEEALERWQGIKDSVGSYTWSALYQQRPSPAKGSIFDLDLVCYWTTDPEKVSDSVILWSPLKPGRDARWLDSWDMAFKGEATSDWVVGQRWCMVGPYRYLIAQQRGRWSFTKTLERIEAWTGDEHPTANPFGSKVHQILVEDKANGTAIIDSLKSKVSGIKPINPLGSKEARARAITPEMESGHVLLPHPDDPGNGWVRDLLSELRDFPNGVHDDQVDALTQALNELRERKPARAYNPGRVQASAKWTPNASNFGRLQKPVGGLGPGARRR